MKKLTTKIISFILTLSMLFSLSVPIFAAESYSNTDFTDSIVSQEEVEAAREAYSSLTPEAKAIFDASLASDKDALKFHKTYIDQNFALPVLKMRAVSVNAVAVVKVDYVADLMNQLKLLNLPASVLSSLRAMGASIAVDIADGPLPVGTILVAASAAAVVTTMALNWDTVSPKIDKISKAFQSTFLKAAANISSAFAEIKSDAKKEADKNAKQEKVIQERYEKAKKDGKPTTNHSAESGSSSLPTKGKPNSSKDLIDKEGLKQRRYYDKNGKADMDIDYRHGGNETHKFPHRHDWNNGVRGKAY